MIFWNALPKAERKKVILALRAALIAAQWNDFHAAYRHLAAHRTEIYALVEDLLARLEIES